MDNVIEPRAWRRFAVRADTTLRQGNTMIKGEVLDLGGGGLFFVPDVGYIDGEVMAGEQCLDGLDLGAEITIEVYGSIVKATVMWMGESARHLRVGLGVKFAVPLYDELEYPLHRAA